MAKGEKRLGRYRLLDLIRQDGDLRLHRALDAKGQAVALWTVPLARLCADAAGLERFRRMAGAAARLFHPAIPAILASGELAGTAFVATAPADGPTLATRLADGPLEWEDTVATLDRVLDALAAAHRAGVIHGALGVDTVLHAGPASVVAGFGRAALTAAAADRSGDLAAAVGLTERLLAAHDQRPGVSALLATLRSDGAGAFPDAGALLRAVTALTGASVSSAGAAPARARRWPRLLGGVAVLGGLAAAAVLNRPAPSVPPPMAMAGDAAPEPASRPPAPHSAPPSALPPSLPPAPPLAAPRQPPVAAVAEALRSIPCVLVGVETTGGRLLVSGTVAGERAETAVRETVERLAAGWDHGFDLATADAQFCAPLGSVATALDTNRALAEPLTVSLLEGSALNADDPLMLEIRAPARPVRLQVDYFTIDGVVVHLLPNPSDSAIALAAGASRRLGERGKDGKPANGRSWTIGPPYGTELLLTIATAEPLFAAPRPEQEPAADYLAALADALAALPEDAPAALADARFIATGP
ncbi:serine/threonine protein kinase [Azospirillum sp. TSH64]|nr:serine/threonine protein kinase [Azospirillum sp. TSH64]